MHDSKTTASTLVKTDCAPTANRVISLINCLQPKLAYVTSPAVWQSTTLAHPVHPFTSPGLGFRTKRKASPKKGVWATGFEGNRPPPTHSELTRHSIPMMLDFYVPCSSVLPLPCSLTFTSHSNPPVFPIWRSNQSLRDTRCAIAPIADCLLSFPSILSVASASSWPSFTVHRSEIKQS